MLIPIVAIVGRPNVGKSTLFNRLIKKKKAVVDETPGVTRDRNYELTYWGKKSFYLVDTGGFAPESRDSILKQVQAQVEAALEEADLILLVLDQRIGVTTVDLNIAKKLRKIQKPTILVANKADREEDQIDIHKLLNLGLGEPLSVSAINGTNAAELLDEIVKKLPSETPAQIEVQTGPRIAIVGRPNVGKSSFVNAILGEEKLIVTDIAGTTRDSIDTTIEKNGTRFTLIDTAGLRKKAKIKEDLDYYTSLRSLRSLQTCDVGILLTEGPTGLLKQDLKIAEQTLSFWRGLVVAVNKWDLVEKDARTAVQYSQYIKQTAPFLDFVPIHFISCKTGKRVIETIQTALKVYEEIHKRVAPDKLQTIMSQVTRTRPPASVKGRDVRIYSCTQVDIKPPAFAFFSNHPELVREDYKRFLTHKIRENFGFDGCPIKIKMRKKE